MLMYGLSLFVPVHNKAQIQACSSNITCTSVLLQKLHSAYVFSELSISLHIPQLTGILRPVIQHFGSGGNKGKNPIQTGASKVTEKHSLYERTTFFITNDSSTHLHKLKQA